MKSDILQKAATKPPRKERGNKMVEVARIMTFGIANRKELIRRLMGCSEFFKNLSFWDAAEQYRHAERNGLVRNCDGYLVVYHDC